VGGCQNNDGHFYVAKMAGGGRREAGGVRMWRKWREIYWWEIKWREIYSMAGSKGGKKIISTDHHQPALTMTPSAGLSAVMTMTPNPTLPPLRQNYPSKKKEWADFKFSIQNSKFEIQYRSSFL
jgi:hypothetical protein